MDLAAKKCVACEGGVPPLPASEVARYLKQLSLPWQAEGNKKIGYEFIFKNFKAAIAFVDKVAALAESEGHHPDLHISYKKVRVELSTHAIGGISENDFILAAKIEQIVSK